MTETRELLNEALQILLKQHSDIIAEAGESEERTREHMICERLYDLIATALEAEL